MALQDRLFALKGYEQPTASEPQELTATKKTKVKAEIKKILANGPVSERRLINRTVYQVARMSGGFAVVAYQVREIIDEMATADEFAPGFGGQVVQAEPTPE